MLSLHQLALAALREECRRRLRAIVRRNYQIWGPRASVDELYNEMGSHVGALCPAVEGLEDEWVGHAREFNDECCLEHLRAAVGQNYPIWGWCQAEAVADLVHNEVLAAVALRATSEEQRQRMYSQFQSGRLDGWINRAHQLYSFETCVHTFTRDIGPFLDAWWTASLGIWNAAAPNPSYHAAQRRGAYLYRVYCQPTPRVISPPGGLVHVLDPLHFGAPWSHAFCPGGLESIAHWLNECELRFLFAIVYMQHWATDPLLRDAREERYERSERMVRTLLELVQRRRRGELDTRVPAVMGRRWADSHVTMLMLRTEPGSQLVAPLSPP